MQDNEELSKENLFKASLLVKTKQKEEKELLELLENVEGISNITTNNE